jgi:TPP-dependent trihydroxycyclohexane-1,2-dione (THcHDO) dehydratase
VKTIRMTTTKATACFPAQQYVERDGQEKRFFE